MVFPETYERSRYHQKEKWSVRLFLKSTKVPFPITELIKVKPFSVVIKNIGKKFENSPSTPAAPVAPINSH